MKIENIKIILTSLLIVILFAITNSFMNTGINNDALFKSILFIVVLYGLMIYRLYKQKRFAKQLGYFVNVVYGIGFVSNIVVGITNYKTLYGGMLIFMCLIGFVLCIMCLYLVRKKDIPVVIK